MRTSSTAWTMVRRPEKKCMPCWMQRQQTVCGTCLLPRTVRRAWNASRRKSTTGILALARAYCTQKGYDLKLEHGSELLYTPAAGYAAVQRQLLTLGDTGWVLLEFVPNITAKELETALQEITGAGYRILVAHIERYPCLAQHGLLARLHEQYRLRCQINCSAVLDSGFWQRMRLEHWVKAGLVDAVSSDAHNCTSRPTRMRQAYAQLCSHVGETTAQKLTGMDGTEYLV